LSAENKQLVTAADQKIAPQYYNPQTDQYEHLRGKNGASNVNVIESALPTGAATAAKQDEQTGHLEALVAKDYATSAKQDSMIAGIGAPADSEATGNGSIVGILKRLRTLLGDSLVTLGSAIGNKAQLIAGSDGTNARAIKTASDGTLLTQLTGSIVEEDRLRVKPIGTAELADLINILNITKDGTAITELVSSTPGRTMLLLDEHVETILWTRSAPSTAFWNQTTAKKKYRSQKPNSVYRRWQQRKRQISKASIKRWRKRYRSSVENTS